MREQRKVVTVLFADVVGSTELASHRDPEVVRSMMSRYFKRIGEIAEAYSGTVEKFAGDAAMVVFGVPTVHDDDAERAVRAGIEIRDAASDLSVRVGINTGEAVTALTEDRQFMVSGDTVNIAARLQQGADAGEVVVGPLTEQLTRNVIEYTAREPVMAKGKTEPLTAFRAVRPRSEVPVQARGVPGLQAELVGRTRELHLLLDTYARTAEESTAHLFTIVGAAGIGKSRLVSEALGRLSGSGVRVLRGRCLPYGRGITYWPLIEMMREDTGISLADETETALGKLGRWLGELLVDDPQLPAISSRLAVMLGLASAETAMPDTPSERVEREIAWGVRHYVQALAKSAPLIMVIDDVQWAEPPMKELIEELVERASDVPLFILTVARPEFFENGQGWSGAKRNSTTMTLDPLNPQETGMLVSRLLEIEALPESLRAQIIERSAGTPLFCEEFIHMLIDEGVVVQDGATWRTAASIAQIRVPEGIHAVLAARLDLLPDEERQVLQAASVIGQRFETGQVRALHDTPNVEPLVDSLRRKGLIVGGDDAREEYRFRHLLIRDAAYGSLPKFARTTLHDRFRAVLEEESGDPQQIIEILSHHAELAFMLSRELGLDEALTASRARHAVRWLFAMAERSRTRHEVDALEATLRSLQAAIASLPLDLSNSARLKLLEAQLLVMKADYPEALKKAKAAAELGEQAGLLSVVATARLAEAWIENWALEGNLESFQQVVDQAIEACQRAGDVPGEIEARHIGTNRLWASGRLAEYAAVNRELVERARAVGDVAHVAAITARLVPSEMARGNMEAAAPYTAEAEELATKHGFRNVALRVKFDRATQPLWRGDLALAERLYREYEAAAVEAGARQHQISALRFLGYVLLHEERPDEAAEILDRALALSETTGERWNRAELLALRAQAAMDSGYLAAADDFIARASEASRPDDLTAVSEVQLHLGRIRAAERRNDEAEQALRHAVEAVAGTGFLNVKAPAALHLALYLAGQGRTQEAEAVAEPYLELLRATSAHLWDPLIHRLRNLTRSNV